MTLPAIVLVSPRNPKNIGAVARVMANFGFADLRIVSPHPPVWEEALVSAVEAADLLRKAVVFPSLREAVADRRRVWGTSCLKGRHPNHELASLPGFRAGGREAIVFGQEKRGLSSSDLEYCDGLLAIPTVPEALSMNLAQAVGVVCYEIAAKSPGPVPAPKRVASKELELLVERAQAALAAVGYRPKLTAAKRSAKLRSLLRRRGLASGEAGFLREVIRRIEERFKSPSS